MSTQTTTDSSINTYLFMIAQALWVTQEGVANQLSKIHKDLQILVNKEVPTVSAPEQ